MINKLNNKWFICHNSSCLTSIVINKNCQFCDITFGKTTSGQNPVLKSSEVQVWLERFLRKC